MFSKKHSIRFIPSKNPVFLNKNKNSLSPNNELPHQALIISPSMTFYSLNLNNFTLNSTKRSNLSIKKKKTLQAKLNDYRKKAHLKLFFQTDNTAFSYF